MSALTDEEAANAVVEMLWHYKQHQPSLGPWRLRPRRWLLTLAIEWKPEDVWIGGFWRRTYFDGFRATDLWICLLPCIPLHFWWYRRFEHGR